MARYRLDAYIIPNTDPHQSEYIADRWKSLTWLTNFTGSAGNVVVTKKFAGLWTDSRYFLQAESQLKDSGFELVKLKVPHTPEYVEWLLENLAVGASVGIDENLFSVRRVRKMKKLFATKKIRIIPIDLMEPLWKEQPSLPKAPVFLHDSQYAGLSKRKKLE